MSFFLWLSKPFSLAAKFFLDIEVDPKGSRE